MKSMTGVNEAFSVGLVAPELLCQPDIPAMLRQELEQWSYRAVFDIAATNGPDVIGTITTDGQLLGTFDIRLAANARGRVRPTATGTPQGQAQQAQHSEALSKAHLIKGRLLCPSFSPTLLLLAALMSSRMRKGWLSARHPLLQTRRRGACPFAGASCESTLFVVAHASGSCSSSAGTSDPGPRVTHSSATKSYSACARMTGSRLSREVKHQPQVAPISAASSA